MKTIEKISETKSWFFGKINKIYKTLVRLVKKKSERAQIKLKIKKEVFPLCHSGLRSNFSDLGHCRGLSSIISMVQRI